VTGLTGLDDSIANWAVDETPILGSIEGAGDASDYLDIAGHVGILATAVAVLGPWRSTMGRVLAEETASVRLTYNTPVFRSLPRQPDRPQPGDYE
jgi:hypothetical protein